MPNAPDPVSSSRAARLLKGAAILFGVLGGAFLLWVGDKWMQRPEMRASQFGFEAPFWPALGGFVLLSIVAIITLFWTAARRVERGDDLFSNRHRTRRSNGSPNPNGSNGSPNPNGEHTS
jgi:nitrogen fixation-related uncharacterized protein